MACLIGQRASSTDAHDSQISACNIPGFILINRGVVSKKKVILFANLRFPDTLLYPEPEVSFLCGKNHRFGAFQDCGCDDLLTGCPDSGVGSADDCAEHLDPRITHPHGQEQEGRCENEFAKEQPAEREEK